MTSHRGRLASASVVLAVSAALWGASTSPVSAGAPTAPVVIDGRDLLIRMGRIERDIRDLQAETFRRPPVPADAGPPPPPRSANAPNAPDLNPIMRRMDELGDSISRLTGQMEELGHQVELLSQKTDRLQKEMDYQSGQAGANPSLSGQLGNAPDDTIASVAPRSSPRALSPSQPSGVLGQIPADAALPSPSGGSALPPPAAAEPKNEFDGAMNLLSRAQYDPASQAFRAFVDAHPDDERAPAALYWAGDIAYSAKKDYQEAARSFAELLKRYPMAARAPEGMLKLGLALLELNQMKEGCAALAALPAKYPNASPTIAARARNERRDNKCR